MSATVTVCQGPPACDLEGDAAVAAQEAGCVWCKRIVVHDDGSETVTEPAGDTKGARMPTDPRPFPRRVYLDLAVPAEKAIWDAMQAVEAMPADLRLTEAGDLLRRAKDKVSDYVDDPANSAASPK